MAPFLQPGDVIEVARCGACDLSIGDLVVFRRAGEVVVHRLLATEGDRFLEKGDAQAIGNWHVWPETFGRVVRLRNEGAPWVDLRRSPWPARMRTQGRLHLFAHKLLAGQPQGAAPASSRLMARLAVAMARRHAGSAVRPRGKVARP